MVGNNLGKGEIILSYYNSLTQEFIVDLNCYLYLFSELTRCNIELRWNSLLISIRSAQNQ